jgi:hypothetical protein
MKKWMSLASVLLLLSGLQVHAQPSVSIPDDIPAPPPDKAQIVFLKPAGNMFASIPVGILALEGDQRRLLGILGENARIIVEVDPGRHRFMSHMQSVTHLMDAEVEAGKRYFVLARFLYGNGFQLRPVRNGTGTPYSAGEPAFAEWLAETRVRPVNKPRTAWYERKDAKVAKHQVRGQTIWDRKTDAERAELTLRPQDAL